MHADNTKKTILLILTGSFLLRLYNLGYHDFWYDEIYTIIQSRSVIGYAWNAPLYYSVVHYWTKLFGLSEFSLRLPSSIFSSLSVVLAFLLGKKLFGIKSAILASLIMSVSSYQLWYAQEARDYSMLLFLSLLAVWFLYKAIKEDSLGSWVCFILISTAGLYTNYFYIFLFIAHLVYALFFRVKRLDFKVTVSFLFIILGFIPYLSRFLYKYFFVSQGFWIPKPTYKSLIVTLQNLCLGSTAPQFLYTLCLIVIVAAFGVVLWNIYRNKSREGLLLCLTLFLVPVLGAFLFSRFVFSVYIDRGLIIASPYLYLIIAYSLLNLKGKIRLLIIVIFLFMLAISLYGYFNNLMFLSSKDRCGLHPKTPVKPLVVFLRTKIKDQDIVIFTNESVMPPFNFYAKDRFVPVYFLFDPSLNDEKWQRPYQVSQFFLPIQKLKTVPFKRAWVIYTNWAKDGSLDENSQRVKNWMDLNLKEELKMEFDGSWLHRYSY